MRLIDAGQIDAGPGSEHWYRFRSERSEPLGHRRELDGIRALAVGSVLLYHARVPWATGGFIGVTVFFTLSGFLITSLALREWLPAATFDVRSFLGRRFRRLLPAAWVTIALVVAMGAAGAWSDGQLRDLRTDVPAALAQVLNWVYVAQGRSYAADMAAPSPLQHFWSLGIEEQFYLAFPLVLLGLLSLSRRTRVHPGGGGRRRLSRARLAAMLGVLLVGSAALSWWQAGRGGDAAYFGTFSRGGEIVLGALLACALLRWTTPTAAAHRLALSCGGVFGLAVLAVMLRGAAVRATWMYPWGFLAVAAASALVIAGALQPGRLQRALGWWPLASLGRISYGVYLLHWPIFLWLSPARIGWSLWPLFALRLAVTLLAAVVLFLAVERPARSLSAIRFPVRAVGLSVAGAALVVSSSVLASDVPAPSALEQMASGVGSEATLPAAPPPIRVLVVGDELAAAGSGLSSAAPDPASTTDGPVAAVTVSAASFPSCGLTVGGWVVLPNGAVELDSARCGDVSGRIAARVAHERPDVVLLWAGLRDTSDRRYQSDQGWSAPGDPRVDGLQRADLAEMLDVVGASGARVAVLTAPHRRGVLPSPDVVAAPRSPDPRVQREKDQEAAAIAEDVPAPRAAEQDDARVAAWNATLGTVAAQRGISVLDAAAAMAAWPGGEFDPTLRAADGTGLTPAGAQRMAAWLADEVRALVAAPVAVVPPVDGADELLGTEEPPPAPGAAPRRRAGDGQVTSVLVAGDSVGFNYAIGLGDEDRDGPRLSASSGVRFGCPIARGGERRFMREIASYGDGCDWSDDAPSLLATYRPDVVLIATGVWEVVDRRFPGEDRWRHIGDPQVDRHLLVELVAAIDTWGSRGATVVLATMPHIDSGRDQGYSDLPESDPARMDRLNEVLREAAAARPGVATIVDVAGWLSEQPGGEMDAAKRVDGVHYDVDYVPILCGWLAEQLDRIARDG